MEIEDVEAIIIWRAVGSKIMPKLTVINSEMMINRNKQWRTVGFMNMNTTACVSAYFLFVLCV